MVEHLGHSTSCATNGVEALAIFNAQGADLVISDWMMPRLDGVQLCRLVRSRTTGDYTYFILLTSLGDDEHRLAGMRAGADDYVGKPFSIDEFEARMIAAERVTDVHRRHEALLKTTRRLAAEADPMRLVELLLREAIDLMCGSAGVVTRWDEERGLLIPVATSGPIKGAPYLRPGEGASGRAAETRAPVLMTNVDNRLDTFLSRAHMRSAVAVPLLHEARLVGTLAVGQSRAGQSDQAFTFEDAELLEMLASTAAAALVALEHARLDGVLLAARTAQHELNNQLAAARGYAEMLIGSPELPSHLRDVAREVMSAADAAAGTVRQLRSISNIRERRWSEPDDTTINLARSQVGQGAL